MSLAKSLGMQSFGGKFPGKPRAWAILAAAVLSPALAQAAPVTADLVISYAPGDAPANYQTPAVSLGNLSGDTSYGGLNPFNPAFSPSQIAIVGQGGSLTLHLSSPVPANGINLGVYSNVGLLDVSSDGSGQAGTPASTFGQISRAIVSVSQDGIRYVGLNGGNPVTFSAPANYYTDTPISSGFQPLGSAHASQSKPFFGDIHSFDGATYAQAKTTLNNSAGGTWLDLRGAVPTAVSYVKFDVPSGSGDRFVVDAIGALGATNTLTPGGRVISEDVGVGAHTSDIVVDFGPQSYDFKVHYDNPISGQQALELLDANTDFKLTLKHFSFGDFVTGLDYGGYKEIGDGSSGNNYWSYYLGDGSTWGLSGQGAGTRLLTDGSYDGWAWTPAQVGPPDFAIVPEPTTGTLAILSLLTLRRRRARN